MGGKTKEGDIEGVKQKRDKIKTEKTPESSQSALPMGEGEKRKQN